MYEPNVCRREAFRLFAAQLPKVDTTEGLLTAAVAISKHELNDVDVGTVKRRIAGLASRASSRIRTANLQAVLAHLHDVVFNEEGFAGNVDDYYSPLNSYIPAILETRRGIPITLTLVYKAVAERLGVTVQGVNSPGHFLARVHGDTQTMLVDPFFGGRLLTDEEAYQQIEQVVGQPVPKDPLILRPATHRQWLARMLTNLHNVFRRRNRDEDMAAMAELRALLGPLD
jgi:regulator of sirC expression with transglutaminase-like and TPR domain